MRPTAPEFFPARDELPTTPGDMVWMPCPLHTRERCKVCEGTGKVLTMVSRKSERYSLVTR